MLYPEECLKKVKKKITALKTGVATLRFRGRSCVYSVKLYMNVNTVLFCRRFCCVCVECGRPRTKFVISNSTFLLL